jgi:hypothetical protein
LKRNDERVSPGSKASAEFGSVSSSRHPALFLPGPHRQSQGFRSATPAALSPLADVSKSGFLTGTTTASDFLARAPAAADRSSDKPAYEYAFESRQSSPAEVLRPWVLSRADEVSARQSVKRSPALRSEYPVASALATGSPRDVLSSMSREARQTTQDRVRLSLRERFAAPGV